MDVTAPQLARTLALLLTLGACPVPPLGEAPEHASWSPGGDDGGSAGASSSTSGGGDGTCEMVQQVHPPTGAAHVTECSVVEYGTNPPTSGSHYPRWADFKTYPSPVPRGFYVHAMEHGAVVVAYNCPDGCADELGALDAFLAARDADPACPPSVRLRVVVTPDPELDTRFAAAAWGAFLKGDCLDLDALGLFMDTYYGRGPEDACSAGVDVASAEADIPADCGR